MYIGNFNNFLQHIEVDKLEYDILHGIHGVFWDEEQQILQIIPCNRNMPSKVYSGPILETIQIEGRTGGYTHLF